MQKNRQRGKALTAPFALPYRASSDSGRLTTAATGYGSPHLLSIREEVLINLKKHDPISDRCNSRIMNSREIPETGCRNRAVANCQKYGGILKDCWPTDAVVFRVEVLRVEHRCLPFHVSVVIAQQPNRRCEVLHTVGNSDLARLALSSR